MTLAKLVKNSRAPVEHHFHNHQWCDASWCPFKDWDEKELEMILVAQEQCKSDAQKEVDSCPVNDSLEDNEAKYSSNQF